MAGFEKMSLSLAARLKPRPFKPSCGRRGTTEAGLCADVAVREFQGWSARVGLGGGMPPPLHEQKQKQIPPVSLRSCVGMTTDFG